MDQKSLQLDRRPTSSHRAHPFPRPDERRNAGLLALEMLHEIRNPLEALRYLVYLAAQKSDHPEQVQRYMQLADEHLATLSRIASQTLHFAEISEGPAPIDLVDLAESALLMHKQTIESKQIHLVKDLPKGLLTGVYRGQMLHVLSNLIVNALESLDPEGTLSIRLRKRDNGLHLLVVDNGHGIAAEHHSHIFQPFFSTKQKTGAGIGLALARQIVEDHQGKLTMRSSTRAGRTGTAFKVYLPAPPKQPEVSPALPH